VILYRETTFSGSLGSRTPGGLALSVDQLTAWKGAQQLSSSRQSPYTRAMRPLQIWMTVKGLSWRTIQDTMTGNGSLGPSEPYGPGSQPAQEPRKTTMERLLTVQRSPVCRPHAKLSQQDVLDGKNSGYQERERPSAQHFGDADDYIIWKGRLALSISPSHAVSRYEPLIYEHTEEAKRLPECASADRILSCAQKPNSSTFFYPCYFKRQSLIAHLTRENVTLPLIIRSLEV
jgi:hypothetical protein